MAYCTHVNFCIFHSSGVAGGWLVFLCYLGSRWRSDRSPCCLLSCSETRDNEEQMTPLSAFTTLKVCSGPEHDSRQQQIDTQNTGIPARRIDCEQGHEVENRFLRYPGKHLQVAFKAGGQNDKDGVQFELGKSWRSTMKKHHELILNIKKCVFLDQGFYES